MKWLEFRKLFQNEKYISTDWIYASVPGFDKRRLYERKKKWYLIPLKRKRYIFGDVQPEYTLLLHISSMIYKPSYISLFTALARYHLIPETVITIQSISSRKTAIYHNTYGAWSYVSCQPHYLWWYNLMHTDNGVVLMADVPKTILDILTYYPEYDDVDDFEALRLDQDLLSDMLDTHQLIQYAHQSSKTVQSRVDRFVKRTT